MDPNEDPPPISPANKDTGPNDNQATTTRRLRDKVTYYEKVWSSGSRNTDDDADGFSIDVQAFEKRLREERDRRINDSSPRIEVKLKSTPQPSPRHLDSPNFNVKVNRFGSSDSSQPDSIEESVERYNEAGEIRGDARIFKFEKVTVKKTTREISITSPSDVKTFFSSERSSRTPSEERILQDDSAYHTQHFSNANTSKSSSIVSLHGHDVVDEGISRRTPSRERTPDSSHSWSSSRGAVTKTSCTPVSSVAAGYLHKRRYPHSDRHASEGEDNSLEWYNDYSTHSFQATAAKMNFNRTNSQYDTHIKQIREEQERVQKKTFVNWINSYLSKRVPPLRINDLILDLRDGTKLLALLEVLSGERLPMERGRVLRRPHFLSNANTALQFLASKKIKLVNINPADLVDGRPPVVLGLIWTIILYFQIEENSRALEYLGHGIGGSHSSLDSVAASSSVQTSDLKAEKWKQGARKTLLTWVTNALPKDSGIEVRDFGASWRDGVAFLALIDAIKANLINLAEMKKASNKQRLEVAFDVAESKLGIARLLDAEDVDVEKPDEKSIMTYVAQFLHKYPEPKGSGRDGVSTLQDEYNEFTQWLHTKTTTYENMIRTNSFPRDFTQYQAAKTEVDGRLSMYNKLKNIVDSKSSVITITPDSWEDISNLWNKLQIQLLYWLWMLDSGLPGDFNVVGKWLAEAEKLLYNDEIPTAMNEETAAIISQKLEEHKKFFADYEQIAEMFERAKQSQYVGQIPLDHLRSMERRLYDVGPKATQRRIRLKFLEHKCCLIAFLNLVENKLRTWSVKYGREDQTQQMLDQYKNFVSRNKIFQEFGKAFMDMQQVVEEYKRDGNITRKDYADIDRFMRETEDRWKSVSMELRCCQSMLEEVVANWKRWNANSDEFEGWLCRAEEKIQGSEDDRLEFFQDISVWKDKHQQIGDSANFLIATCTDPIANELRSVFMNLSSRFDHLFSNAKQYMHAGDILRNRQDYRSGAEKIAKWIKNAEDILSRQPIGSSDQIKSYGDELQKLSTEIEEIDEIFKSTSRVVQTLIQDLSRDDVDKMMNTLKNQKEALVRIRAQIPIKLHLFHQLMIQQESLEQGQKEIHQWLDEGEQLLQTLSLSGGRDEVNEQLNRHRNYFSRTLYYKSMLESKNKVFQSLIKSVAFDKTIDTSEQIERMKQLNERFAYVVQNSQQWEHRLQEAGRCWHNFKESERVVSEWLNQADILLSERHIDSKQAIDTQKLFFENVNERWMNDLVQTAQDLIKSLPANEHQHIIDIVEKLQGKWKEVLGTAPLHLMRLEFRLDESTFTHYLKDIEKEIHLEQQALNKNEDIATIMQRNQEYFKNKGTVVQVERCLSNMERISKTFAQYDQKDQSLANGFKNAEQQWDRVAERIEDMRKTLQQIPAQWDYYREKFAEMVSWMDTVDETLKSIINEVNSMEEFERERVVFQTICREADSKREEMKWLVKTLDSLLPYATDQEATTEQRSLEALIARYKNLIPTIEVTMVKTEVFSKCYTYRREVHEVVCLLNKVKEQTINAPAPDSLERVNKMIQEQQFAISQLDHQRTHIMSMLQRGRDLSKDAHAPAFVTNEVKTLENGWNGVYNETVDKLRSLKGTQSVWNEFHEQKMDIMNLLGTAEGELRSITPLQTDPKNVSSDLKNKRELNQTLQQASRQMIQRLHELCDELTPLADPTKRPILEKEVVEIEKQFFNTMEHVKDRVGYLEDYSAKWNSYKARLADLQAWAAKTAPQLIEAIQSLELSPEERVAKANTLQKTLTEKMKALDMLASDASELAPKEGNFLEAKRLKGEVFKLQETLSALNRNVDHQATAVKEDLINWQKYQTGIQEIKPWIEQSESKINFAVAKPVTLQEAVQLQHQAKQFEKQCEQQLDKLHGVASISNQMLCKTNAADELDAVSSRWSSVQENAKQVTNKFEKLVTGWQALDADASKLEHWITDNEKAISKRPDLTNTPYVDKLEKELVKLKLFNNEISEQQAKLVTLTQLSDQIGLSLAPEGAVALKERINSMKGKISKLSETVRGKINSISDAIMARQDFNAKMANFSNWMDQLRGQVVQVEEINAERVEPSLQTVHALLQEHSEKKPVFSAIRDEVKDLTQRATPEESLIINDSYAALVSNYDEIENDLQRKKGSLEKWSELIGWKNETEGHINHIKHQLDKAEKIEPQNLLKIVSEIDEVTKSVAHWRSQAMQIDDNPVVHLRDMATRKPLSAVQIVNDLGNKLDTLKLKSQGQMDAIHKMKERKSRFNNLENQLVTHLAQNKQKLAEILRSTPNFSNIDQIISDLVALNEVMQRQASLKDKIHDEGVQLMKDDISSMPAIQESILVLDKNWDGLQQEIVDRIQKYTIISQGLKDYADAKIVLLKNCKKH